MAGSEQVAKYETEALTLAQQAGELRIHDQQSYDQGMHFLEGVRHFRRQLDAEYDPLIHTTNQAHNQAIALKRRIEKPAIQAELIVKQRKVGFDLEQRRIQDEEQRRREAEAKRIHEESVLKQAEHAEGLGMPRATVDAILDQPDIAPPPAAPPMHRIDKRVYTRNVWKGEITDMKALIAAAASGKAPPTLLQGNQTAINALAKSLRDTMDIPGLRAYCDKVPAGRF